MATEEPRLLIEPVASPFARSRLTTGFMGSTFAFAIAMGIWMLVDLFPQGKLQPVAFRSLQMSAPDMAVVLGVGVSAPDVAGITLKPTDPSVGLSIITSEASAWSLSWNEVADWVNVAQSEQENDQSSPGPGEYAQGACPVRANAVVTWDQEEADAELGRNYYFPQSFAVCVESVAAPSGAFLYIHSTQPWFEELVRDEALGVAVTIESIVLTITHTGNA